MTTPSRRIRQIANELDMNLTDFSRNLGFNKGSISKALHSEKISITTAKLIEHRFGYRADWIMTGEEPVYVVNDSELPKISEAEFEFITYLRSLPYRVRGFLFALVQAILPAIERSKHDSR